MGVVSSLPASYDTFPGATGRPVVVVRILLRFHGHSSGVAVHSTGATVFVRVQPWWRMGEAFPGSLDFGEGQGEGE